MAQATERYQSTNPVAQLGGFDGAKNRDPSETQRSAFSANLQVKDRYPCAQRLREGEGVLERSQVVAVAWRFTIDAKFKFNFRVRGSGCKL